MSKDVFQTIAVIICIVLAVFGTICLAIGARREAKPSTPGSGLALMVWGTILLGFSGIVVSLAGKLLGN